MCIPHDKLITRFAKRNYFPTNEDREDFIQDVRLELWTCHVDRKRANVRTAAGVLTVCRRKYYHSIANRALQLELEVFLEEYLGKPVQPSVEGFVIARDLIVSLGQDNTERAIAVLILVWGLDVEETATSLDLTPKEVKKILSILKERASD